MASVSVLRSRGPRSRIADTGTFNAPCTAPTAFVPRIEAQRAIAPSSLSIDPQSSFSGLKSGVLVATQEVRVAGLGGDRPTRRGWQIYGDERSGDGMTVVANKARNEDWGGGRGGWVFTTADEGWVVTVAGEASRAGGASSLSLIVPLSFWPVSPLFWVVPVCCITDQVRSSYRQT
jgi:hypothetical protein